MVVHDASVSISVDHTSLLRFMYCHGHFARPYLHCALGERSIWGGAHAGLKGRPCHRRTLM